MTKRSELETALEEKCVKYATACDFTNLKADKIKKGWPDQFFFGPYSTVIVVEFKLPGAEPDNKQKSIHRLLLRLGFRVRIIDTFPDFIALLTSYGHYAADAAATLSSIR